MLVVVLYWMFLQSITVIFENPSTTTTDGNRHQPNYYQTTLRDKLLT